MSKQSGFSVLELAVILMVIAVIAAAGYAVMNRGTDGVGDAYKNAGSEESADVPAVDKTSDLDSASETLDQEDIEANQTDSSQLDSELNNF